MYKPNKTFSKNFFVPAANILFWRKWKLEVVWNVTVGQSVAEFL